MLGMTRRVESGWRRLALGVAVFLVGAGVTGLGVLFTRQGLEQADQLASVIGAFIGLAGLGLANYSAWLARAALAAGPPTPPAVSGPGAATGPSVTDSIITGGNVQAGGD